MKNKESFIEKIGFSISTTIKLLTPPFNSLEKLEKHCKAHIQKNPEACIPRRFLAELYKGFKKYEAARKEYFEIKNLGCMTDRAQRDFGEVLFMLEDYQGTIEALAPIAEKHPNDRGGNYFLGVSYINWKILNI